MEGLRESNEEVNLKAGEAMEVKQKEEQQVTDNNEKMGSCKDEVTGTRPAMVVTSGPNAVAPAPDQLTIFYRGRVIVFDAISAEKASEIMRIAAATAAAVKPAEMKKTEAGSPTNTPVLSRSPSMQSTASALASAGAQLYPINNSSLCKLQAELPIARRHSLQRFFEKRRDRLVSKNPYATSPASKKEETRKADPSVEAQADAGCFGKPLASQEELQSNVAVSPA